MKITPCNREETTMATNRGLSYQLSKELMCRSSKGKRKIEVDEKFIVHYDEWKAKK